MLQISWDGSLRVFGLPAESRNDQVIEIQLAETNIRYIGNCNCLALQPTKEESP